MKRTGWFLTGFIATALAIAIGCAQMGWAQTVTPIPGTYAKVLQSNTSSASSNGSVLTLNAQVPKTLITATGTFSGAAFTIQGSADNTTYVNVECVSSDQRVSYTVNGWLSATGLYFCNTTGVNYLQATIASGTPGGVTISASGITSNFNFEQRLATGVCVLQTATSSTGTGTPCVNSGYTLVTVQIGGTPGTVKVQGTVDGTNWGDLVCIDQPGMAYTQSTQVAGVLYCEAQGYTQVRTNISVAGTSITAQASFSIGKLASLF